MLTFNEVLSLKSDILDKYQVKYVRHKDSRKEYRELIKDRGELLKYQAEQAMGSPMSHFSGSYLSN